MTIDHSAVQGAGPLAWSGLGAAPSRVNGPDCVVRRLSAYRRLPPSEVACLLGLGPAERHPSGRLLSNVSEIRQAPRFIVAGWAARARVLPDGRRQILTFLLPGDALGVWPSPGHDWSVTALKGLATVDASPLLARLRDPAAATRGLADACRAAALEDQAWMAETVMRLGRLSAYQRVAHLLLELRLRLARVGLVREERCPLPLTQEDLADSLGLSVVHVNRTLQALRSDGLLDVRSGWLRIPDPSQLARTACFQAPRMAAPA